MVLIRLNKYISDCGECSRRKADMLILAGEISVNERKVTELGFKIDPNKDTVKHKQMLLKPIEKHLYILLNKPKNCISTSYDPQGRRTVMDLLPKNIIQKRPFTVGRLDRNTTGVLILTTDGFLANTLMHPSSNITKEYSVFLDRFLDYKDIQKIKKGVLLDDGFFKVDELTIDSKNKKHIILKIHSGRNRIIRRLFEKIGYKVTDLDRFTYAGITKQGLQLGEFKLITNIKNLFPESFNNENDLN